MEDPTPCTGILVLGWIVGTMYLSSCRRMGRVSRNQSTTLNTLVLVDRCMSKVSYVLLILLTITVYYIIGGRSIVVYLGLGDTLQLYRDVGSGEIQYTTFCVSLTTFDIV